MQEQMAKTQAELEEKTVEVSAAGGKVKVTANGAGDIIAIKIDKEVVDPNDVEFLEEMVLSAVKQAIEQGLRTTTKVANINAVITDGKVMKLENLPEAEDLVARFAPKSKTGKALTSIVATE